MSDIIHSREHSAEDLSQTSPEPVVQEWRRGEYLISTDPAMLDLETIHRFLSGSSYWAAGRPFDVTKRAVANSLSFGLYKSKRQAGFARVVTDRATFAWLADVFVLEEFRGQGLGKWLVGVIIEHPELEGLRRWMLATRDAHELYRKYGFTLFSDPERWMTRENRG